MGTTCTHNLPGYDEAYALDLYQTALHNTCLLPDVGIDESLLKYSGLNSSAVLQAYSNGLVDTVPGFVYKLGATLRGFTQIPNAVGLGALIISMIIEIASKSSKQPGPDKYGLLRRVFGEEKASAVRDTMSDYVQRHILYLHDTQRLAEELRRHEETLSIQLTTLENSLLIDNHMSTRGFKIWVNGAAFRLEIMFHEARLKVQAGEPESQLVKTIEAAIDFYLQHLDDLLEKFKSYKITTTKLEPQFAFNYFSKACPGSCAFCHITNPDVPKCRIFHGRESLVVCNGCDTTKFLMNNIFSNYKPISSLRNYFSDMKNNINFRINQHDAFTVPSST